MDEDRRRTYRLIGRAFILVGAIFVGLDVVQRLSGLELLNGSPYRVALLVIAIGAALLWTVREPPEA